MTDTLIFAPGLLCDEVVWAEQIRALQPRAAVQVADYGELDSLPAMAESILECAPARFALAGHSMGGRVALEVMRRAPERITHLGLLDTGYKPLPLGEEGVKERAGRFALLEEAKQNGMRAMAKVWVQNMVHPSRLGEALLIDTVLQMFSRKTPGIYAAQINALLNRPDATSVVARIRCPTLILCGAEDAPATLAQHREMATAIPDSIEVVIPVCGHMAPLERPYDVNRALAAWLKGV